MATWRCVPLDSPAANRLAEMQGIADDLGRVALFALRFIDPENPLDPVASEGVAAAAMVLYARCFSQGGVRPKIPECIVESLSENQRGLHKYVIEVRNKFLAHSVNNYELNRTTACVPLEPPPGWALNASALGHQQHRFVSPSKETMLGLSTLAAEVKGAVEVWAESEKPCALEEARAIPPLDLCKRDMALLGPTNWEDVGKRR